MLAKNIAVLVAAAALSAPAFADRGGHGKHRGHGWGHGPRHVVVHQPHYVVHHRPAVVHHYYHRPAPRPVLVYQQPAPNGAALLVGAVLGAAIVHHVVTGY